MLTVSRIPVVKTEMLIRRPIKEVYEAFVEPEITTNFWFTKSSGRLEKGRNVQWEWEMYGVADDVYVRDMEINRRILVEWSDGTETEWQFSPRKDNHTLVSITASGYSGSGDAIVSRAVDDMGGYTIVLCGLKAFLEHSIALNLVADKAPDANINGWTGE